MAGLWLKEMVRYHSWISTTEAVQWLLRSCNSRYTHIYTKSYMVYAILYVGLRTVVSFGVGSSLLHMVDLLAQSGKDRLLFSLVFWLCLPPDNLASYCFVRSSNVLHWSLGYTCTWASVHWSRCLDNNTSSVCYFSPNCCILKLSKTNSRGQPLY
jgi:hypothetical protein